MLVDLGLLFIHTRAWAGQLGTGELSKEVCLWSWPFLLKHLRVHQDSNTELLSGAPDPHQVSSLRQDTGVIPAGLTT